MFFILLVCGCICSGGEPHVYTKTFYGNETLHDQKPVTSYANSCGEIIPTTSTVLVLQTTTSTQVYFLTKFQQLIKQENDVVPNPSSETKQENTVLISSSTKSPYYELASSTTTYSTVCID